MLRLPEKVFDFLQNVYIAQWFRERKVQYIFYRQRIANDSIVLFRENLIEKESNFLVDMYSCFDVLFYSEEVSKKYHTQ